MAHAEYTAKSASSSISVAAADVFTGCRQVTITERGRPAATPIDITHAADSAYSYMADPLGAKGSPSCEIVVEGFLSVTDKQDSGILDEAIDGTDTIIVKKETNGDWFTATSAVFRSFETEAPFAGVVPFTATYALDSSSGSWADAA